MPRKPPTPLEKERTKEIRERLHPIAFTLTEGGYWYPWRYRQLTGDDSFHAVCFDDGSVFDFVNGWRFGTQDVGWMLVTAKKCFREHFAKQSEMERQAGRFDACDPAPRVRFAKTGVKF